MSIYFSTGVIDEDEPCGAPLIYRLAHVLPSDDDPRGGSVDLGYIPGFITRDGLDVDGDSDPDCENEGVWPFLRLSVQPVQPPSEARRRARKARCYGWVYRWCRRLGLPHPSWSWPEDTVVLDRAQVVALRDELSDWLLRLDDPDGWLEQRETPS